MATIAEIKEHIARAAHKGTVPHAQLFYGEDMAAIAELLRLAARFLETEQWEGDKPLIDFFEVRAGGETGIDAIRALREFLWQRPFASRYKVAILPRLDCLTVQAEQAMLKIAEEPPKHGVLLVGARAPERLPETLASRFQKMFVSGKRDFADVESARAFLQKDSRARREELKSRPEAEESLADFAETLIAYLARDTAKNYVTLAALLDRLKNMRQYNTNARLQLEAALETI